MSTPERFRARAEEAERLADLVSYGRDKERLNAQAAELRQQAELLETSLNMKALEPPPRRRLPAWLRRLLTPSNNAAA
jgi:hypothetical protein